MKDLVTSQNTSRHFPRDFPGIDSIGSIIRGFYKGDGMSITAPSGKVAHTSATDTPTVRRLKELVFFPRERVRSLKSVLRYKNEHVVAKIMKECELDLEAATRLFEDTLRFLWLAGNFRACVPSPLIDKGWHTFLLFTMEYQKFCHKYFRRFVHHRPHHIGDTPDGSALARTMSLVVSKLKLELTGNWQYFTAADAAACDGRCSFGKCDGCREHCKDDAA